MTVANVTNHGIIHVGQKGENYAPYAAVTVLPVSLVSETLEYVSKGRKT